MVIIQARDLTKSFKQTEAVVNIDLDVEDGEIFGLVGPNGAGKTTLIQLLAGLLDQTSGSAIVLGFDTRRNSEAIRQVIGYVSQEFSLYGSLSVAENLDFFADLYGVPVAARDARKAKLLAWSRLSAFRDRRAEKLSGGMQKKLHLCCTLIHEPKILFLDEPTAGVDPVSRRELWEILNDLVADGLTLVVTTPYMDEAEQCHRVAFLNHGRMLACDSPDALKKRITEAVWELRSEALPQTRKLIDDTELPIRSHLHGDSVRILAPAELDIAAELRRITGTAQTGLRQVSPNMEDVFVSIVGGADSEVALASSRAAEVSLRQADTACDGVAIRVERLTKVFGNFVAVENVSLSVARGEVFGFLGPNGSGKTTTIRMLCGLLPPSSGYGEVLGQDVGRQGAKIKSRIGYMSQRFSLYNDLTVLENLAFFGGGYGVPSQFFNERSQRILEMCGLEGQERRLARELSGGVKQRLALGCAILHEPEVVFLDEPTAGSDPISRWHFWDLIGELAAQGVAIFVTTHYLDEAENCHRVGLMYQGRLVALGSPQGLKDGMKAGVMVEVQCRERLKALHLLRSVPSLGRASLFGSRVHLLVEDASQAEVEVRRKLESEGISVDRFEPIPFSLEDLFVIFIGMEEQRRRETSV